MIVAAITPVRFHPFKPLQASCIFSFLNIFMLFSFIYLSSSFQYPKGVTRVASASFSRSNIARSSTAATTTKTSMKSTETALVESHQGISSCSPNVAIIGAGAAGLVTARILSSNGFTTQIFEKELHTSTVKHPKSNNNGIGGVWSYTKNSKTKPMYKGLRTNLPRELMAYRSKKWGGDGTSTSFVTHEEVQTYLNEYMHENDLEKFINFDCTVKQLKVLTNKGANDDIDDIDDIDDRIDDFSKSCIGEYPQVELQWESSSNNERHRQTFDAVCICNGHYSAPSSPPIQGLDSYFKGDILHSIEYDDPKIFKDKTVLCIGGRASGSDLAREISQFASKVYLSDTSCPIDDNGKPIVEHNVYWVPKTIHVDEKGGIHFDKSCTECPNDVDVIIFCSGYDYNFPFINDESNLYLSVVPGERRVSPLYEQLWHAQYPNIAFVGLQHSVVPFPFFEFQAEAIAKQLIMKMDAYKGKEKNDGNKDSHILKVPASIEVRMENALRDANSGGPKENGRVQDTHFLGSYQWDACRLYARYGGVLDIDVENHIATNQAIYDHSNKARKDLFPGGPDLYRYYSYVRDDENRSFSCSPVKVKQEEMSNI